MTGVRWTRAEADTLDDCRREHRLISAHRCRCGWEGDDAFVHVLDALASADVTVVAGHLEQVGLIIDGAEFVPLDVARDHMPFAVPPGGSAAAVYRVVEP